MFIDLWIKQTIIKTANDNNTTLRY